VGENMEAEYTTANEWYEANRRELKKYRGQWIAYTNQGVISCDRDYRKMKDGIPADTPKLGYVLDRIFESEFVEPVRFYPVRMRSLKSHDWQPRYELHLKVQNSERVEMLVDSGAELSLTTKRLGEDLGCSRTAQESVRKADGVGGSIEYLLRDIEVQVEEQSY
jgi:Family of unknown function (DUF5678)